MNMNPAHWHLIFNHIPIVGGMFSVMVLLYGIARTNTSIIQLSYWLFAFCAVTSFITTTTGENAEHYLKDLNKIEDAYLKKHVRIAGIANKGMIGLGILSLMTLFVNKINNLKFMPYIILILSLAIASAMFYTGETGGEIMHKEIRTDTMPLK